jgi:hypothetical protein
MSFPSTINLSYGQEKVQTSGKKQKFGTRATTPDGRVFYYARDDGTGLGNAGVIVDGTGAVAAHDMDVAATATSVGSTTLTVGTSLTVTAAQAALYVDGYLMFNDGPGEGEVYRIKSVSVVSGATGCVITIDEPDGFRTALTTASLFGIIYNPYAAVKLIDGDGTQTTGPLGVAPIPITADYYFWLQTFGPAAVEVSGTTAMTLGNAIEVSEVSGQSGMATLHDSSGATDLEPIGVAISVAAVSTDFQQVMLKIRS